jgi:NAD/NADP transhydrogenase beta subunit
MTKRNGAPLTVRCERSRRAKNPQDGLLRSTGQDARIAPSATIPRRGKGETYELDHINPEFQTTDVAVVIEANDVVNPDARDNPKSPIAGMPILEVDRAKSVVVLKRGRGKGFSGLENPLFYKQDCEMLYGDAKDAITQLVQEVRNA